MLSFFAIFERDLLAAAEEEAARTGKPFHIVASGVSFITTKRHLGPSDLDEFVDADAVEGGADQATVLASRLRLRAQPSGGMGFHRLPSDKHRLLNGHR